MEQLKEFLQHEDPIIRDVANQLNTLANGVYNDELSQEQFDELANDLLEVEAV